MHGSGSPVGRLRPDIGTFTRRTCEFHRVALPVVDHGVMITLDSHFGHAHDAADTGNDPERWPSLSLVVDPLLGVVRWMLTAAGRWIRNLGSPTQLGPDPEQQTGRETGVRT